MNSRALQIALLILSLPVPAAPTFAKCNLAVLAELPVTMVGRSPMVSVQFNGSDARLMADSGAFYSIITPPSAAEFKLKLDPAPFNFVVAGIGGQAEVWLTTVREFTIAGVSIPRVEFIVGGSEPGNGAVGSLGQNVLGIADVEYDLANGAIRLMRPHACGGAQLAYWAKSIPYSAIDIDRLDGWSRHTIGTAFLNGVKIRVLFDTGASTSMLSLRAASRAGVTPEAAGVVAAGLSSGIGRGTVETWIAPFASFKIGDEQVRNTRLRLGAVNLEEADMLIGADFFLSHRILVANSQRKLYFTYNGGPVFNLKSSPLRAVVNAAPPDASAQPEEDAQLPDDAAALSRRGAASTSRADFEHAIADLTRACELMPLEPTYFYQRGVAYWKSDQPTLAMADFEQALKLKPDGVDTLVSRAELRLAGGDYAGANADLDAADRYAPKQADLRFVIAGAYLHAELFEAAITQYSLWIAAHRQDVKLAEALNDRCWTRALWGHDLEQALTDCNAALRLSPSSAHMLDSRGLVRLRLGQFDQSISDYDAVLSQSPKTAWSLYGRGVDKLRKGMTAAGQTDLDAAGALQPKIAELASKYGIAP